MQIEILALRHQLAVLRLRKKRLRLRAADRLLWGDPFPSLEAIEPNAGDRQTGNSDGLVSSKA